MNTLVQIDLDLKDTTVLIFDKSHITQVVHLPLRACGTTLISSRFSHQYNFYSDSLQISDHLTLLLFSVMASIGAVLLRCAVLQKELHLKHRPCEGQLGVTHQSVMVNTGLLARLKGVCWQTLKHLRFSLQNLKR